MTHQLARRRLVLQQLQRSPAIEVPQLVSLHHMPSAELVPLQQVVDGCDRGTRTARRLDPRWRAIDLAIPAALGMRLQREFRDQLRSLAHVRLTPFVSRRNRKPITAVTLATMTGYHSPL